MKNEIQHNIRYQVNRFIFEKGYAPTVEQLSELLAVDKTLIKKGLSTLANEQMIVLHPNSYEIWVAHPFALFPTLFWVKTKDKQWWGNCAWCSLGIASLAKTDTEILTKLNGQEKSAVIEIKNNEIMQKNYVAHFPIPAKNFWDNVIYTCSMMLVFENEAEIDTWCHQHNKPKGEVLPIEQVWQLAQIWYGNYVNQDFQLKTKEIANEMFQKVGLTSEFWKL